LLDEEGIQNYQSFILISTRWTVYLALSNIARTVMTLSSFRSLTRQGHLEIAKFFCSYHHKMEHAKLCFRTGEPGFSGIPNYEYDRENILYGKVHEDTPNYIPERLDQHVTLSLYVDAKFVSLSHIWHLIVQTPIDWFTKSRQLQKPQLMVVATCTCV